MQMGEKILSDAGIDHKVLLVPNFLEWADLVRDVIKSWPNSKREETIGLKDFIESLKKLRDDFEEVVKADPMILFRPAHSVSLDFLSSTAMVRYFFSGNRCSKTESAAYDVYAAMTGQMIYRPALPLPVSVFVVGTNFTQYGPQVFEKKFIEGEPGNPLSPIFPYEGKWFNGYDRHHRLLRVACRECANRNKARDCKHASRSTLQLFSDETGPDAIAGGQHSLGWFDENVDETYFSEAMQRLRNVPKSSLMVTRTPLGGKSRWEYQRLYLVFERGGEDNLIPGSDRQLVSCHTIDQYSAGLIAHQDIDAMRKLYAPIEAEARIFGKHVAYSESAVFDTWIMSEMFDECLKPKLVELRVTCLSDELEDQFGNWDEKERLAAWDRKCFYISHHKIQSGEIKPLEAKQSGGYKIFEFPEPEAQYVIGADVAQGLAGRDYSCAQVLKIIKIGLEYFYEQVAMFHGHINSIAYAKVLYKLGKFYNDAVVVIERRGPGDATIQEMTRELGYDNIFRDIIDPAQTGWGQDFAFGIDTNVKTKGIIISMLQNSIKHAETGKRYLIIRDVYTLEEFGHFGQERTESGLSYRFRGTQGAHDDTVIAVAIAIYATETYPDLFDYDKERRRKLRKIAELSEHDTNFWSDVHKTEEENSREESESYV